jgi:hypothetical protein
MKVKIKIPDHVIAISIECGYDVKSTKKLFKEFLTRLVNHDYGQGELDFENWVDGLEAEEIATVLSE